MKHFPEEPEDKDKIPQDSQSPDRDLNQGHLEYELGMLTGRPRRSAIAGMIDSSTA